VVDPTQPNSLQQVGGSEAGCHLEDLLEEILREEKGVWSTLVYVQSIDNPEIIKVYHPRRAGCGCGGEGGIIPWWVLSRIQPESVPQWQEKNGESNLPKERGGGLSWIKKIF
jgi:hypothetical protein